MHAVTEFVGERHHVARLALIIEQHIGMRRRHGRMREGARRLAGTHRRIDPFVVEEAFRRFRPCAAKTRHRPQAPYRAPRPRHSALSATLGSGALRSQWASSSLPNHLAFSR